MSLAVSLTTAGDPARARAVLARVRAHADEIVVGIGPGAPEGLAAAVGDLADRVYRSPVAVPDRYAVFCCASEWVLRLEDAETPSQALLDALPELMRDRRVSWFDVPRVSLGAHLPGPLDPQPRLVRNVAGLRGIGEHRLAPDGIYWAGPALAGSPPPVPAADRGATLALLDPPPFSGGPDPEVESLTEAEITRPVLRRPVSPGTYAGRVDLGVTPPTVRRGVAHQQELRVTNEGDEWWPAGDCEARPIRVGWRWRRAADGSVVRDGRDLLTATLRPGETLRQALTVVTPEAPGDYLLEVELVHEHVRWFGTPARATLRVVDAPEHRLLSAP